MQAFVETHLAGGGIMMIDSGPSLERGRTARLRRSTKPLSR
jgi:hypothetical protein